MKISVIKVGGNILDDKASLDQFIESLSKMNEPFVLVHGGGKILNELAKQLTIRQQLVDGKRITTPETLELALMTYAGLINKKLVAQLNAKGKTAIGLSGADAKCIISKKRAVNGINYGEVGDVLTEKTNTELIVQLLNANLVPVFCSVTYSEKGELLNSNADAIASALAKALIKNHQVKLIYCFEKNGVLHSVDDENSVLPTLDSLTFNILKQEKKIHSGMVAKLDHAFDASKNGVKDINIIHANYLTETLQGNTNGTCITN